jgi:alcohol dehydrogenase
LFPLIAIPTTAGTGSEVTIGAVIRDAQQGLKLELNSGYMQPDVALLDPELTTGLPPAMTAASGMDALAHAIEGYASLYAEPISDALCLHAIRMIVPALPRAVADGVDMDARGQMLLAATVAGLGFSNALCGIVHALAHACGGRYNVAHGAAVAVLLTHGMEFNLLQTAEKYRDVAEAMALDVRGEPAEVAATMAVMALARLREQMGLPCCLRELSVPHDALPQLAEDAMGDAMMISNPRPATAEDMLEILERAY